MKTILDYAAFILVSFLPSSETGRAMQLCGECVSSLRLWMTARKEESRND